MKAREKEQPARRIYSGARRDEKNRGPREMRSILWGGVPLGFVSLVFMGGTS